MFQQTVLVGYLGRDPEVKSMQSGKLVANLSVATSETWKQDGERKEKTEWHRVVVFEPAAKFVSDYCNKGDLVLVVGKIQTRKWQDQSGNDKYSTEIVVGGFDSKITKLNKSEGGGSRDRDEEEDTSRGRGRGSDRGGSTRSTRRRGGDDSLDDNGGDAGRRGRSDELDDDIPF